MTEWFSTNVPGATGPLQYKKLPGGRSNLTFAVEDGAGKRWILRRPPLGDGSGSGDRMAREWAILDALKDSRVPVPRAVRLCVDRGVTGSEFYVVEFIDGIVLADDASASSIPEAARAGLSLNIVDTLAEIHAVGCSTPEFDAFRRSGSYLDRQLHRWSKSMHSSGLTDPARDRLHRRLSENKPEERWTGIVHGDYRPGNLMVAADGSVRGVLDWELWSVGDVLADLGWLVATWSSADAVGWAPDVDSGFASPADVVARYEWVSGRSAESIDFYHAFALWRLACIARGALARYRNGEMGEHDVDLVVLANRAETLVDRAHVVLDAHS